MGVPGAVDLSPPRSPSVSGLRPILHGGTSSPHRRQSVDPRELKGTVGQPVRLLQVSIVYNDTVVLGIESVYSNGVEARHGDVEAQPGSQQEVVELDDGEHITRIGIKCQNAVRNSHISAMMVHTTKGVRTKWLGGSAGAPRILEKSGQVVVGFAGRSSHCIDALGVVTSALETGELSRGLVYGGPSGVPFNDVISVDCSQLSNFVLKAAFKDYSSSYMLESARQLFQKMDDISGKGRKREALLNEASKYFGVSFVDAVSEAAVSPLVESCRREYGERKMSQNSDMQAYPLTFNVFTDEFAVVDRGVTASCQVSAGWRTLVSSTPLPLEQAAGGAVHVELGVTEELRIIDIGIAYASFAGKFVGCDSHSCGYQSTGHFVANGELSHAPNREITRGTNISLLVTTSEVVFYKSGKKMGAVPRPSKPEGCEIDLPYLAVSCYMGPNTFSIIGCTIWCEETCKGFKEFPPPQLD